MKKPKVIRFRCYCFECSDDDEAADIQIRPDAAEPDLHEKNSGESDPRLMPDVIGKLLFGA